MFIGDIFDYRFYCNNVVGGGAYFMYTKMGGGMWPAVTDNTSVYGEYLRINTHP